MIPAIKIKRVYEKPDPADGRRILVDRLWPRGLAKRDADLDLWAKVLAPSAAHRKWFNHDPELWEAFREKYRKELKGNKELAAFIEQFRQEKRLTLLYSARDEEHNQAVVLKEFLQDLFKDQ